MTEVTATLTSRGISLIIDGDPQVVDKNHPSFDNIIQALEKRDYDSIPDLINVSKTVETYGQGKVSVRNGEVFYNEEVITNDLTERILQMISMNLDAAPMLKFLERLMKNPSYKSREQLYGFMEACDMPITADGRLLAYKSVNENYWDTHTGRTYLNTVGSVIKMERSKVDDDPNRTCSAGLHVCSQQYGMYGSRLLLVAVDPADVVSVPKEYHQAKMRVCRYEVIKDVQHEGFRSFDDEPVYQDYDINDDYEEDDEWHF